MARLGSPSWLSLGGITLSSDAPSTGGFDFTPLSFLQINYTVVGYSVDDALCIRFNGDSSSIYSYHCMTLDLSTSYIGGLSYFEVSASAGSYIRVCALTGTAQQTGTIYLSCMPKKGAITANL